MSDMGSFGQFSPKMGMGNVYKNTEDTSMGRKDMNNALMSGKKSWNHTERGNHPTGDMGSLGQSRPKMGKQCRRNIPGTHSGGCVDKQDALMRVVKFSWTVGNARKGR